MLWVSNRKDWLNDFKRQAILRDKVHDDFKEILKPLQFTQNYKNLISAMFKDAWDGHAAMNNNAAQKIKKDLLQTNKEISGLVERIMSSTNATVSAAYEKKITALEQRKLIL